MKYLRSFETEADYSAYTQSQEYVTPNVCLIKDEQTVAMNKYEEPTPPIHDYSEDYLTIESLSDNNIIRWYANHTAITKTISISIDSGKTWTDKASSKSYEEGADYPGTTLATLNDGEELWIKGSNTSYGSLSSSTGSRYNNFYSTGNCNVKGNIMSLIYDDNFIGQTAFPTNSSCNFMDLFATTKIVDASNLILPATAMTIRCYQSLFSNAKTLKFAPELPSTSLAYCCYVGLFYNCSSLTEAPVLSATTLADSCYSSMFYGCTGLTTAPILPATTLAVGCYSEMFLLCYNLTTAPELPASTLVESCYEGMFKSCYKLNYIKCLATNISAERCTYEWATSVASTGTFVKDSSMTSWPRHSSGIPYSWTVEDYTE